MIWFRSLFRKRRVGTYIDFVVAILIDSHLDASFVLNLDCSQRSAGEELVHCEGKVTYHKKAIRG